MSPRPQPRRLLWLPLWIACLLGSPIAAQGTAADSAHWRATKIDLDSIARDKTAPQYSKRAQARIRVRDSLRTVPLPAPAPPPVPSPAVASVEIHGTGASLNVGATMQLVAVPKDANGVTLLTPVQWSAGPGEVATISGVGVLSGWKAGTVTVTARADTVVGTRVFTVTGVMDTAITPTPSPPPAPSPAPSTALFSHPFSAPTNGAVLAEFPRDTVDVSYPAIARRVSCSNLQACLDTAKSGDEIRLPKGASFTDVTVKPTARASWVVVRTDVTDVELGGPWERMTATKANALNLATIRSSGGSIPAITVASSAHHVRFEGVRVTTTAAQTNALVRVGLYESDPAQLPHHITLAHVVVDPGAFDLRRCLVFDGAYLAVISSTLANCHSQAGDSQGVLSINGRGPLRIENNAIAAGHQSVFLGGGDPAIRGQVPSDIVIRRNDLSRPLSWKGVWQVKTNIELKIGKRVLIEGNVLCHTWPDAQAGFAFLGKTENQDGGTAGDWSETSDVTVRYNRICGAAGAFNLAPLPQGPGIPMSRVTIYGNIADSVGVAPYQGDTGDALQLLGVADVVFQDNWVRNPTGRSCIYSANPNPRFVGRGLTCGGEYGIRGEGGLAYTMPGAIVTGNTVVPWSTAFGAWPASPANAVRDSLLAGVVVVP